MPTLLSQVKENLNTGMQIVWFSSQTVTEILASIMISRQGISDNRITLASLMPTLLNQVKENLNTGMQIF